MIGAFGDDRDLDPFWQGARLGILQANALACPLALCSIAGPWWSRLPFVLGMAFGWAGWARRDFALRVSAPTRRTNVVQLVCESTTMSLKPGQPLERVTMTAIFPVDPEQARQLADMLLRPIRLTALVEEVAAPRIPAPRDDRPRASDSR